MFSDKTMLITGGTGSFGQAFVSYLLNHHKGIRAVIVFSRDEQKQFEMAQRFSSSHYPIRYILGDIRDKASLKRAMQGVDIVIHTASMKHVAFAQSNPMECVKSNILGSQNLIDVAMEEESVKQVVALSTDKASEPINVYGASKLIVERLFTLADSIKMKRKIKFSVVRYGNIFGSRGSVVPFFMRERARGVLPITDIRMTRFSMTLQQSVDLVLYALKEAWGGEIMIPKIPSYNIMDLAKAIAPHASHEMVGVRQGEKIDEVLFSASEASFVVDRGDYYILCPLDGLWSKERYLQETGAKAVESGVAYDSKSNSNFLSIEQIEALLGVL
jgi:UDP-N-acetylglucosamine 4,6-dehydratase